MKKVIASSPIPSLSVNGDMFPKGMNHLPAISLCKSLVPQGAVGTKENKIPFTPPEISEAVYNILKHVARRRHTITYKELAAAFGLVWGHSYGQCRRLYPILKGICRAETAQGRPMLGAVVVRRDGTPGQGFFRGARDLGRLTGEDEYSFWLSERDKVWENWGVKQETGKKGLEYREPEKGQGGEIDDR